MHLWHCRLKLKEAQAFVAEHHRHSEPLRRHRFSIGAHQAGLRLPLLGIATVDDCSSAWSKRPDHCELRRLCTTGQDNVASFLLGKVCQASFALGYRCIVTYTRPWETGASLRAAGFHVQKRGAMKRCSDGTIEGGLLQWIKAAGREPTPEERHFTKDVIAQANAFAQASA